MGNGTCWATIHRVPKETCLSNWTTATCFMKFMYHPVFKWVSGKPTCDSLSALKQQPPLPEIVFGSFKSAHLTPRGKEVGSYWTQHLFLSQCLHFGIQLRTIFHKRHSRCMASYCPAFHCVWDKKEKITGAFTSMLIVLKCGVLKIALNTWWKL